MKKLLNIKNLTDNKQPDYVLFYATSILIIIGIIFSYSLSVYTVIYLGYDQFHFLLRQLFIGILSICMMWFFAQIKPEKLLPFIGWSSFVVFGLLILSMPILPPSIIVESGGASRWIRLPGLSISPVEFFKVGFIYYLAHSFYRRIYFNKISSYFKEIKLIAPYGIIFVIIAYFVAVVQKDLGQTAVIAVVIFLMLFFAHRSLKIFISILAIATVGIGALIVFFPHRINRIQSWWGMVQDRILPYFPDSIAAKLKLDTYTEAYQVGHAINAINNGSMFGEGLSNGYLKLGFLGEVHTDFVLAGIIEEIGFVGITLVVLLFSFVIIRIFRVSRYLDNTKYHLFTIGIAVMLGTSFIINAFGTSGIIPIKGLAVPFLSYGGSSLLASSIAIGLVLSISRNSIDYKKDRYEK